jgi:hypothetical protein
MKKSKKLTQAKLKELFHYDPETGIFRWKINTEKYQIGEIAGYIGSHGYLVIGFNKKQYLNHRLAWLYVHGYFPENDLDHTDKNPLNNKINNLREVSRSCNMRNTGNKKNNTSGIKGVSWDKRGKQWEVKIWINKKGKYLGYYKNFDDAVCARLAGEQCLNWEGCDTCSPAYQYVQKMLKRRNINA